MSEWHGYLAIEDVALTEEQRDAVIAAFNQLGPGSDPQPARLLHRRLSTDKSKAIFEAEFNEDNLTVGNVKWFIANAVGVDPELISHEVQQIARGTLVIYSAGGTPRMRFLAFAGVGSTWEESRQQVLIYLKNNAAEWGEDAA